MKNFIFIISLIAISSIVNAQPTQGGIFCSEAAPICTDSQYDYPL